MATKNNKVLATIIILTLLVGAVIAVWYINKQKDPNPGQIGSQGEFPIANNGGERPDTKVEIEPYTPPAPINGKLPQLIKLTNEPIAGAIAFTKDETETVRYFSKNGEIREINMSNIEDTQLDIKTVQNVHDAIWKNDGETYIIRFLDKIKGDDVIRTYWSNITKSEDETEPAAGFFPDNIRELAASYDNSQISYICTDKCDFLAKENSFGITSNFDGTSKKQVMFSPLTQWQIQWPSEDMFTITSAPSYGIPGYLYKVDPNSNKMVRLLGDIPALTTTINPTGDKVLYAGSGESYVTGIHTLSQHNTVNIPLKVVPEKCAWGTVRTELAYCSVPKELTEKGFPDNWYQGVVSYEDTLWVIDTDAVANTNIVIKLSQEGGEKIDAINLFFGPNDDYLYFTNKVDNALWSYRLVE